jgi:hypothetical protein
MIYQNSITRLIESVWKDVLMQRKKSFIVLLIITALIPLFITFLAGLMIGNTNEKLVVFEFSIITIFTLLIMTFVTQVSAAYIVLSTSDNLMDIKNNQFVKLFKESFVKLLKLYILKLFIYLAVGLVIGIISWFLYIIFNGAGQVLGLSLLILSLIFINCFTILSPYYVILEHMNSVDAIKKSLRTIISNKTMFLKMYLFLLFAITMANLIFKITILNSCISIFFEILIAYICMKSIEGRNEV